MPLILTPSVQIPAAGYYASRAEMARLMQDTFAADFNQRTSTTPTVPDEVLVQAAIDGADSRVDQIAMEIGLTFAVAGPPTHAVADTDEPLFSGLRMWASRWARADGHGFRGTTSAEQGIDDFGTPATDPARGQGPEGLFTQMKREAERNIRALLKAKQAGASIGFNANAEGIGVSAINVGCARRSTPGDVDVWG